MVKKANYMGPVEWAPPIIGNCNSLSEGMTPGEAEGAREFRKWKQRKLMRSIKRRNKERLQKMIGKYV
jgi:hypothetical protein